MVQRIREVPHFRWKLHEVPMGLDLPYWVEDENFRYENHFKRIAVPSPGDREALSELVAHLYSRSSGLLRASREASMRSCKNYTTA